MHSKRSSPPEELRNYWARVRTRTEAVLACVPDDRIDWSPGSGAMTFGDVIRHLALTERWLFVEVACGRLSRYESHDARWGNSLADVRAFMTRLHGESQELLAAFSTVDLDRPVVTPGGASMAAWKWLRAMCEHEVHHRGQLYLMLRLSGIETPPIFGMTSEAVGSLATHAQEQ
jgi:uncharacterized damage-inducible protein DinB